MGLRLTVVLGELGVPEAAVSLREPRGRSVAENLDRLIALARVAIRPEELYAHVQEQVLARGDQMSGRVNLLDPEVIADSYTYYAQMRRDSPVCEVDPGGIWAVTRYEDTMRIFKDPELFSSEGMRRGMEPPWIPYNPVARSVLVMDPPEHGRMRSLVSRAFGSQLIARLEPFVRDVTERLVDSMLESREVDFITAMAMPLPAFAIGRVLGLDDELHTQFKRWADDIAGASAVSPSDTERQAQVRASLLEMEGYMTTVLEKSRRAPGNDMASDLLAARVNGEALTEAELISFMLLLLAAGLETTRHLLGNIAMLLADRPEVQERLRGDLSLIPSFVDEALRYECPARAVFRLTTAEVEFGAVKLPADAVIAVLIGSACRDEAFVPDADKLVLGRKVQLNLPFGHGIHFCVGAALARLEARVALEVLLTRVRSLSRKAEPLVWHPSLQIHGLSRLPVEVLPA